MIADVDVAVAFAAKSRATCKSDCFGLFQTGFERGMVDEPGPFFRTSQSGQMS